MTENISDIATLSEQESDNTLQETLDSSMNRFRTFLCDTWMGLPEWMRVEEGDQPALRDWLQANWEILVEDNVSAELSTSKPGFSKHRCYFEVYARGSDSSSQSHRVSDPDALATHEIHIGYGYRFDSFGTEQGDSFMQVPPFDYVLGVNNRGESMWFKASAVDYSIEIISRFDKVERSRPGQVEKSQRSNKAPRTLFARIATLVLGPALAGILSYFLCQFLHPDSALAALIFGSVFCLNTLLSPRPGQAIFLFLLLMIMAWFGFPHIPALEQLNSLPRVLIGEVSGIIIGMTTAKIATRFVF